MPIIFCDINLGSYEIPIIIVDNNNLFTPYYSNIDNLAQSISHLAYSKGITNIKLRGISEYTRPLIEEIKTTYGLRYNKNDLEIEVL